MTPHLTEAQLFDLLAATSEAAASPAQLHLAECAQCQDEFTTISAPFANFRVAATHFALLHTPPRPAVGNTVHRSFFALPRMVWATGLATVLAATGVTLSTLHHPARVPSVRVAASPQPVSDEALLQDIDSDLSTSVPPSLQPLDTATTSSEQTSTSTSN